MKIQFLGATGTVTGSKYLLDGGDYRLLIDCGLFQGLKELRLKNWAEFPVPPNSVNTVILTHAHLDHSGFLPLLVKRGFRGKVLCTPATFDLCKILLPDSGKLQEEESGYANRKSYSKHHPALPLYTQEDAVKCLSYFHPLSFDKEVILSDKIRVEFTRAGHILGASLVTIRTPSFSLVFTGDLGRPNDLIMLPPEYIDKADYLVVESTYGDREHEEKDVVDELYNIIDRTFKRGGSVIIPAFSVGRSQVLLYALAKLKKSGRVGKMPVYLDSPMSINATEIFRQFPGEHRLSPEDCRATFEAVRYVREQEESKELDQKKDSMVIISASGMATGGRVLHHLKAFAPDSKNTILFTGFQAAGTRGATMLSGARTVKIHGEEIPIAAEVANINSFSAHSDRKETLQWLSHFKAAPRKTFITHGEPNSALALKEAIERNLHWTCYLPKYLETIEL
jgi:metallo-beta-lactamase family protein